MLVVVSYLWEFLCFDYATKILMCCYEVFHMCSARCIGLWASPVTVHVHVHVISTWCTVTLLVSIYHISLCGI